MLRGTLRIAACAAAAVLSITLASGDASARPGGGGGRGGHVGGFHAGGIHAGGVRAYHGGAVNRGFYGGSAGIHRGVGIVGHPVARGGAYRVGGRYHGGVWYGTGRHYWNGRWYPYGVGSCWLLSPIGYVWVCG